MGENTKIQWTDYTFNPWRGCSKVHAGCTHCYAEREAKRFPQNRGIWGKDGTRVKASHAMWRKPLKWNRAAEKAGERRRVFCASLADVFEEWGGPVFNHLGQYGIKQGDPVDIAWLDEPIGQLGYPSNSLTIADLRARLFAIIDATPYLDWLLVTKRPENVRRMWPARREASAWEMEHQASWAADFRPNTWLLTSVSDQETAEALIPELLECRDLVPVLGLSIEPLLGPIDLTRLQTPGARSGLCYNALHATDENRYYEAPASIDWVIIGGESGPHARPCNVQWIRDLVRQCKAAGVPCFVKQLGAKPTFDNYDDSQEWPKGVYFDSPEDNEPDGPNVAILNDSHGGDPDEWPEDLRVREFPRVEVAHA